MNKDALTQLEHELTHIKPSFAHSRLYKILRDNLTVLGYWKNKPRGNPSKGYSKSKAAQERAEKNYAYKLYKESTNNQ